MTARRERAKAQNLQLNKQLEAADTGQKPQQGVNQRQEKLANFLIRRGEIRIHRHHYHVALQ